VQNFCGSTRRFCDRQNLTTCLHSFSMRLLLAVPRSVWCRMQKLKTAVLSLFLVQPRQGQEQSELAVAASRKPDMRRRFVAGRVEQSELAVAARRNQTALVHLHSFACATIVVWLICLTFVKTNIPYAWSLVAKGGCKKRFCDALGKMLTLECVLASLAILKFNVTTGEYYMILTDVFA